MNMLAAYDIADPRRLARVAKVMKDYGLRVQKSVFELEVDERLFASLRSRVEEILEPEEDGVKYFPLCGQCAGSLLVIGQGAPAATDEEYLVI